jgi:hypothetical protein
MKFNYPKPIDPSKRYRKGFSKFRRLYPWEEGRG